MSCDVSVPTQFHSLREVSVPTQFHSLREVSEQGYGPVSTLRHYIRTGRLKAYKVGGSIKIARQDLDALVVPVGPKAAAEAVLIAELEAAAARAAAAITLNPEQLSRISSLLVGASR